jgi:hypothetical protein
VLGVPTTADVKEVVYSKVAGGFTLSILDQQGKMHKFTGFRESVRAPPSAWGWSSFVPVQLMKGFFGSGAGCGACSVCIQLNAGLTT